MHLRGGAEAAEALLPSKLASACAHKQSRSTLNNFHVYSFIPTVHLSDGIVHKLDAFFQPLIDKITNLHLHGTINNNKSRRAS